MDEEEDVKQRYMLEGGPWSGRQLWFSQGSSRTVTFTLNKMHGFYMEMSDCNVMEWVEVPV